MVKEANAAFCLCSFSLPANYAAQKTVGEEWRQRSETFTVKTMKELWHQIEKWITDNHPAVLKTLNNGATEQELANFEALIGQALPEDFKEFLSIHNGQTWTNLTLFDGDRLLSLSEITDEWNTWKSVMPTLTAQCLQQYGAPPVSTPDTGIKNDWWNCLWIPITSNGSGDSYCIDLDPTIEGHRGQILRMDHEDARRALIASSFHQWVENFARDLKNGIYVPSSEIGRGGIVTRR